MQKDSGCEFKISSKCSLASFPGLQSFHVHKEEGELGILSHMTNVTPYTEVGMVVGHVN